MATVAQSIAYATKLLSYASASGDVINITYYGATATGQPVTSPSLSGVENPHGIQVTYDVGSFQEVWAFHDDGRVAIVSDASLDDVLRNMSYQLFDATIYASVDLIPARQFFQELVLLG